MNKEKIIVALDVSTAAEAREKIELLRNDVGAFKIGLQLFTAAGASFVREIVESGIKVFLDLKFHDIPNTVAKASVEATRLGVWMFNLHASGGSEMIKRTLGEVSEACEKEKLRRPIIIGVTVLTSSNQQTLNEIGIDFSPLEQVLRLAKLAETSGLDGIVASPLETAEIKRKIQNKDFLVITPGVRPTLNDSQQPKSDDQKRIMTPGEALKAGSDYLVIGRPILSAKDPVGAARQILEEITK